MYRTSLQTCHACLLTLAQSDCEPGIPAVNVKFQLLYLENLPVSHGTCTVDVPYQLTNLRSQCAAVNVKFQLLYTKIEKPRAGTDFKKIN